MSALAADNTIAINFAYPFASIEDGDYDYSYDCQAPSYNSSQDYQVIDLTADLESSPPCTMATYFDPSLLEMPYSNSHNRSSSRSSIYSTFSTVESNADTVSTRFSTPPRASPPVRSHGPLLLPKIRPQSQDLEAANVAATIPRKRRAKASTAITPPAKMIKRQASSASTSTSAHTRSLTNPETLNSVAYAHLYSFGTPTPVPRVQKLPNVHGQMQQQPQDDSFANSLLCSPASFVQDPEPLSRRASYAAVDAVATEKYAYPTYPQAPFSMPLPQQFTHEFIFSTPAYDPRASPAHSMSATPDPVPVPVPQQHTTTLQAYLTTPNPTANLVRTLNFPHRDPNLKHFWWDIRSVHPWASFTAQTVYSLTSLGALLPTPVSAALLPPVPAFSSRHPETEAALHALHAAHYIPKLNAALALASPDPVQFSLPKPSPSSKTAASDLVFLASAPSDGSSATALFGGKPTSRVVGLTRSYGRFNTGMRSDGNIKKVEYLKGLAALHHQMREHSTRYGFILTEIELVLVRSGTERTPHFGDLEVTSIPLTSSEQGNDSDDDDNSNNTMTACLALFALTHLLASDEPPQGYPSWKTDIGAPAEGTRKKANGREAWIPAPQLAEKREAKRSRGWVWPEDAVGRKELGKRGIKYGNV